MTDFIRVVEQTIAQYRRHPTIHFADGLDEERAALRYANLDPNVIEQTLDHIADVADRLRQLDTEIAKATNYDTHVYVPPSPTETMITNGDGSFEPKKQIPRIKTICYVVEQEHGVDISNPDEAMVVRGEVESSMMRKTSYYSLEFPAINRLVLACDEEGNATYVFDTAILDKNDFPTEELAHCNKQFFNELIAELPASGQRIIYTKNFVGDLIESLNEITDKTDSAPRQATKTGEYLKKVEAPPEGYRSAHGIADNLGMSDNPVRKAINELDDALTPKLGKFGSRIANVYSLEDQEKIREYIEHNKRR